MEPVLLDIVPADYYSNDENVNYESGCDGTMSNSEATASKPASQEIFAQVEQNLTPGPVRDLWWSVRSELGDGGPEAVRTYLQAEFERRRTILRDALEELTTRLQETE